MKRKTPRPRRLQKDRSRPEVKYPLATIAHYGPDDQHVTKIAVGIFESEDAEPIMDRWIGPDVMTNPEVQVQIAGFIEAHGVRQAVMSDGIIGCPHEEGIDFPEGQECPYCPFWHGKRDIQAVDEIPDTDPRQVLKLFTRLHLSLIWYSAQLGLPLEGEDARLVRVMQEHPEYSDLWDRLEELSDEELERDGTNPIMHITIHHTIENQIAEAGPKEVRRVLKALRRQGLSRHEAIHRIGSALTDEIWHILHEERPFDKANYVQKLQELVR